MILARIDEATLRTVVNENQAQSAQLKTTQRLANELDATLVRRRDGTYYLRAGSIHGEVPIGKVDWPQQYDPDAVEVATHNWLAKLADSLEAELLYDGRRMEWFLRWPNSTGPEEETAHVKAQPDSL